MGRGQFFAVFYSSVRSMIINNQTETGLDNFTKSQFPPRDILRYKFLVIPAHI